MTLALTFLIGLTIALPENPSAVERTAAAELRAAAERMGAQEAPTFVIRSDASLGYDGIAIVPGAGEVTLIGHPVRGPIYAVDVYLEKYCGVRWWTPTESHYPKLAALPVPTAPYRHVPTFRFRETYYKDSFKADFKVHQKGNYSSVTRYMLEPMEFIPPEKGGNHRIHLFKGRNSAYHSFFEILPPAKYFAAHPDWYAEAEGKRHQTQLCLTNPEMTAEFIRETRAILRADPESDIISISQNDGSHISMIGPCQCAKCLAVEAEEGGEHSGPILRFVNTVAAALEAEFPHVTFETFAYSYSYPAPAKVTARHNVVVRYCDIGCPFSFPLETKGNFACEKWMDNLRKWQERAPGRVFIWDYVTDFTNYMLPHPNLFSLAPNIRTFAKAGAIGVFEQGDALCSAGAFARLKHWYIAHLLWDAAADEQTLLDDFLVGYYGAQAAPKLKEYLELVNRPPAIAKNPVGCYHLNVNNFMFPGTIYAAYRAMAAALDAATAEGPAFAERVRREKLSIDQAILLNWETLRKWYDAAWLDWEFGDDKIAYAKRWVAACRAFGVIAFRETTTRDTFENYVRQITTPEKEKSK